MTRVGSTLKKREDKTTAREIKPLPSSPLRARANACTAPISLVGVAMAALGASFVAFSQKSTSTGIHPPRLGGKAGPAPEPGKILMTSFINAPTTEHPQPVPDHVYLKKAIEELSPSSQVEHVDPLEFGGTFLPNFLKKMRADLQEKGLSNKDKKNIESQFLSEARKGSFPGVSLDAAEYRYLRNVVARGPDGAILSADADSHESRLTSVGMLKNYLKKTNLSYKQLQHAANLADVQWYPDLDLLIIFHGLIESPSACKTNADFYPGCVDKTKEIITAFGKPAHVLQIAKNMAEKNENKNNNPLIPLHTCYDGDLFLQLSTNKEGETIAIAYPKCIAENPSHADLLGKNQALQWLRDSGIKVIEIGKKDFNNLAPNFIAPERGKLIFTTGIGKKLQKQLTENGFTFSTHDAGKPMFGHKHVRAGIHCHTVELGPFKTEQKLPKN